jgi:endonuclease III related protein
MRAKNAVNPVLCLRPSVRHEQRVSSKSRRRQLNEIYDCLLAAFGPQRWWPGETPFEVMVGAILTQSASWLNVEKAIANLKLAGALSPWAIRRVPLEELAQLIRPSGYYNAKARKLKALTSWLERYGDDLDRAFDGPLPAKRAELLAVHGVGPETADSILLYAAGRPSFVIDAYTRRVLGRLGIMSEQEGYEACRALFTTNLDPDVARYNEYHALFVRLGKDLCRKRLPRCPECPLRGRCRSSG